jgi:hypothetical protein
VKLPELKRPDFGKPSAGRRGSDLHMPDFIVDLYSDLRDRRLLPLVVLLLVGIVAAPILIGGSKKSHETVAPPVVAAPGATGNNASFSVVPASEELQEYKKRLAHRRSVNPFNSWTAEKRKRPSPEALARDARAIEEGGSLPPKGEPASGGTPAASSPGPTTTTVVTKPVVKATLKAQVGVAAVLKAGFNGSGLDEVEVEDQARLPQKNPAVIYNGYSKKDNPGALFLMTSQVTEYSGEGHCALGGAACQMIELKIGQSETFAIGYGETRYTVKLVGFEPIVKEEVIEAEGRKVRVPNHRGRESRGAGHGPEGGAAGGGSTEQEVKEEEEAEAAGTEPSPRLLLR